jgi:hypothetical protein
MSATQTLDLGAILGGIGQFLVSFFNTLVQYAPMILSITVAGVLVYKYANVIRRAIGQLTSFF